MGLQVDPADRDEDDVPADPVTEEQHEAVRECEAHHRQHDADADVEPPPGPGDPVAGGLLLFGAILQRVDPIAEIGVFDCGEEIADRHVQRIGDEREGLEAGILSRFKTLDGTDPDAALVREPLLRPTATLPQFHYSCAVHGSHASRTPYVSTTSR